MGASLLLAAVGLPLAVRGLRSRGYTRWLATFALSLNGALTALFAMMWLV